MKVLRLVCHCGKVKLFTGHTVYDILKAIDASDGWQDRAYIKDKSLGQGMAAGTCPEHMDSVDFPDPREPQ